MNATNGQAEQAERNAKEALEQAKATLERTLRELDRYIEQLDSAQTTKDKAKVMSWAINALASNILPNLRLDLLANAQAELTGADKV